MGERVARRILLLGWDAADWKIIQPLLDAGRLPHLEQLINEGVSGNLATLKPILSPMLWTSIATGKLADQHGIHGFVEPRPDGSGLRPVTATSLSAQPLWNILERNGQRSAVVGWFATHPANEVAGTHGLTDRRAPNKASFRVKRQMPFFRKSSLSFGFSAILSASMSLTDILTLPYS